jgi:HAD superfamily hydrolase (TIGR01509 family)
MQYRAIVFDLFRTVVMMTERAPSGQVHEAHWRSAMRALQPRAEPWLAGAAFEDFLDALIAASEEIARNRPPEYREVPIAERYRRALLRLGQFGDSAAERAERLAALQLEAQAANTVLPASHRAALTALAARCPLGLVSNYDHAPTARAILARHDLEGIFSAVVISIEIGRRKPHPEIFRTALQRLGVDTGAALFVGDSAVEDVGGASAAGMDACWLNPRGTALPDGVPKPRFIIGDLGELPELVSR